LINLSDVTNLGIIILREGRGKVGSNISAVA